MSGLRPFFGDEDVIVELGGDIHIELCNAVLDIDGMGEVLGVEILGVLAGCPDLHLPAGQSGMTLSVDSEADALYLRFRDGRSMEQSVRPAALVLNSLDELLGLRVKAPNT